MKWDSRGRNDSAVKIPTHTKIEIKEAHDLLRTTQMDAHKSDALQLFSVRHSLTILDFMPAPLQSDKSLWVYFTKQTKMFVKVLTASVTGRFKN